MSWGTLRNWLDDDIGHRAVRQRLDAASLYTALILALAAGLVLLTSQLQSLPAKDDAPAGARTN